MALIKESCVETYTDWIKAEKRGVDRIELYSRLDLDSLKPSKDVVKRLVSELTILIKVMIRSRKGGFCYSVEEIKQMHRDILDFRPFGVFSIVFGVLSSDKIVDIDVVNQLV